MHSFAASDTFVAIQVLVVVNLAGSAADVGLINASRWLPYLLLGLVAGALVDRWPRRPVLIAADLVRALLLGIIPLLALTGHLNIWLLATFLAVFGLFSLAGDAAFQSIVPRLVPAAQLTRAHARLDQSDAASQASGPALAGGLISMIGAPLAILADAVSYLFSGLILLGMKVDEPKAKPAKGSSMRRDIGEGLRWVYGHPRLAPMALGTHAWFVCNGLQGAVVAPFALASLHFSPLVYGVVLAAQGVGGLLGSLNAARLGAALGAGRAVILARAASPLGFVLIALAPPGIAGAVMIAAGQAVFGFSMGAENSNSMGYRQTVTPDRLQARMNITIRSINRGVLVVAAPLGGLMADRIGYRPALWIAALGFALVALALALSKFREARLDEAPAG